MSAGARTRPRDGGRRGGRIAGRLRPGPELPTGAAKVAAVDAMFDAIAPRYDLCNRVISLGLDVGWRRRTVRSLDLPPGGRVLDLACGTGDLCRELCRSGLVPVGIDRSAGMLASARTTAPLVRGDALRLPFQDGALDGIVCGFALRNFAELPPVLRECARVLRAGGRVAFLEVDTPAQPLMRLGHELWFGRVVPLVGGWLSATSGAPRAPVVEAYRYLPRSVAYLPTPDELAAQMRQAGFGTVAREPLTGGIAQLVTAGRTDTEAASGSEPASRSEPASGPGTGPEPGRGPGPR